MTKNHSLSVKITEECYKKLCHIAEKDRRTPSGMARYLILEHIGTMRRCLDELNFEGSALGERAYAAGAPLLIAKGVGKLQGPAGPLTPKRMLGHKAP